MSDPVFDYDNNEFLYWIDEDHATDSQGNIIERVDDNLAMDLSTGAVHLTSDWSEPEEDDVFAVDTDYDDVQEDEGEDEEDEEENEEDDCVVSRTEQNTPISASRTSAGTYRTRSYYSSYSNSRPSPPVNRPNKESTPSGVGCAAVFWGLIATIALVIWTGEKLDGLQTIAIWVVITIIILAFVLFKNSAGSSAGGTSGQRLE